MLSSLPSILRKSRMTLLVAHLVIIMTRGPVLAPKRLKLGVNTALHRVMRTCPNCYHKLGPALTNNKGRNLPAPLPVQPGPLLIMMLVLWQEVQGVQVMRPHLTQIHPGKMWLTDMGHSFQGLHHLLRHRQSDHTNHLEEVPEEGRSFL